jgi:chromosome segregation ATPase
VLTMCVCFCRLDAMRSEELEAAGGLAELEKKKDKSLKRRSQAQESLNSLNIKIGALKSEVTPCSPASELYLSSSSLFNI